MCQLEQIKDHQERRQLFKDFDDAWHEVQSRNHQQKTEHENSDAHCRWRYNKSVQDFLKLQMADKKERSMKVYDEQNEERKQFARICKEDFEREQQRLGDELKERKSIGDAISVKAKFSIFPLSLRCFLSFQRQMRENYQIRKKQLDRELKMDQIINEKIRMDLETDIKAERAEKERFCRDVFTYLEHLSATRHHNDTVEREKEKLLEDIRVKTNEDEVRKCCEAKQKRLLVNQVARLGQVEQIKRIEKLMTEEALKEKKENEMFNERELLERVKIREAQWQQRLKAHRYGRELMEQRKNEELRDAAEKQNLHERLVLAAQDREQSETMGNEFVNSYQDVLPLHPNLLIIQKGKKY